MTTGYPTPGEQRSPEWRAVTAHLADICKRNPARFAELVRLNDARCAAGMSREDAWALTLADD